eukprot:6124733-Amphidinium_carterae.1
MFTVTGTLQRWKANVWYMHHKGIEPEKARHHKGFMEAIQNDAASATPMMDASITCWLEMLASATKKSEFFVYIIYP